MLEPPASESGPCFASLPIVQLGIDTELLPIPLDLVLSVTESPTKFTGNVNCKTLKSGVSDCVELLTRVLNRMAEDSGQRISTLLRSC